MALPNYFPAECPRGGLTAIGDNQWAQWLGGGVAGIMG
jgi:hypothetical protein